LCFAYFWCAKNGCQQLPGRSVIQKNRRAQALDALSSLCVSLSVSPDRDSERASLLRKVLGMLKARQWREQPQQQQEAEKKLKRKKNQD
jgi:hypothetical protein